MKGRKDTLDFPEDEEDDEHVVADETDDDDDGSFADGAEFELQEDQLASNESARFASHYEVEFLDTQQLGMLLEVSANDEATLFLFFQNRHDF